MRSTTPASDNTIYRVTAANTGNPSGRYDIRRVFGLFKTDHSATKHIDGYGYAKVSKGELETAADRLATLIDFNSW